MLRNGDMKNKDIIIALNEEILIGYMREQLYVKGIKEKKKYSKLIKEVCERLECMYNLGGKYNG